LRRSQPKRNGRVTIYPLGNLICIENFNLNAARISTTAIYVVVSGPEEIALAARFRDYEKVIT
jgi:hypothetical protein